MLKHSQKKKGKIGIAGHIGVGHAYSHAGRVIDDSIGFATLVEILQQVYHFDLAISSIKVIDGREVEIVLQNGGVGKAIAKRGFTPFEVDLLQRGIGTKYSSSQTLATYLFGRIYGHGACDHIVAVSLAHSRALLDTIKIACPEPLIFADDDVPYSQGGFLGGVIDVNEIPVSWLLTINTGIDGSGPNEDSEGIIPIGNKANVMNEIGMNSIPIIVIDGKIYSPTVYSPDMGEITNECEIFVRWNNDVDNPIVGESLCASAKKLGHSYNYTREAYPRDNSLHEMTVDMGQRICDLGKAYSASSTAAKKVKLAEELSIIATQDIGASIYMTEKIFDIAGSGGLWPGQGAMLSFIVSEKHLNKWKALVLFPEEIKMACDIVIGAIGVLWENYDEAVSYVIKRKPLISAKQLLDWASEELN